MLGDYVVHDSYGIGQYLGIKHLMLKDIIKIIYMWLMLEMIQPLYSS